MGRGLSPGHQGRARQDGTMEVRKMLTGSDPLGTSTVVDLGLTGETGGGGAHGQRHPPWRDSATLEMSLGQRTQGRNLGPRTSWSGTCT